MKFIKLVNEILSEENLDIEYFDAINQKDMIKLKRMVNIAADKAGYNVSGTHITDSIFSSFDLDKFGENDFGYFGKGFYFGAGHWDKENAKKRAIWYPNKLEGKYCLYVYLKLGNNIRQFAGESQLGSGIKNEYDSMTIRDPYTGIDSEYVVKHPYQIKSADPITYIDNKIVPLSHRFNDQSNNIML